MTAQDTHDHDLSVLTSGEPQEILETVPTQDGRPHHWLVVKFPMMDAAGKKFVAGVGVDVTERRHAEKALAKQAEREAITHGISQAVRSTLETSEIFGSAVRELGSYLGVDRCSIFMKDEKARHLRNVAEYHAAGVKPAATDFALGDLTSLAEALGEKGVRFSTMCQRRTDKDSLRKDPQRRSVQSIMYVAIRVGDEVPAAFALSTLENSGIGPIRTSRLQRQLPTNRIAIRQAQLTKSRSHFDARVFG